MLNRLKNHSGLRKLQVQFFQLPRRDQKALQLLVSALLAGFLYFALWLPANSYHDRALASRDNAAELLTWMNGHAAGIRQLASAGAIKTSAGVDKPTDGRALMGLVTRSAKDYGLLLQRFEPSGDSAVRIWMDNVPFADVAAWLESLNAQNGVVIEQAALEQAAEAGRITARLTLGL